jgi:hypothetical protein
MEREWQTNEDEVGGREDRTHRIGDGQAEAEGAAAFARTRRSSTPRLESRDGQGRRGKRPLAWTERTRFIGKALSTVSSAPVTDKWVAEPFSLRPHGITKFSERSTGFERSAHKAPVWRASAGSGSITVASWSWRSYQNQDPRAPMNSACVSEGQ